MLAANDLADLSSLSLKKMRKKAMDQVEREVISYVLAKTAWNRSKATKILKISYKTLLYKIKELGIQPPPDAL
jgi:DNA-binding NtrC family response regulator